MFVRAAEMRVERGERHELYLAVGAVVRVRRVHHHLVALLYLLQPILML